MADTPENINNLHQNEETIYKASLNEIMGNEALLDHLQAIHDALDHLVILLKVESATGSDLHTMQLFVIRLFNTGACTLKLGLSGYYQTAFQTLRDSLEMVNLIDHFRADSSIVSQWRSAEDKKLKKDFSPVAVRKALANYPQYQGQNRDEMYALISGYASHMTYKGFSLISPANAPTLGKSVV